MPMYFHNAWRLLKRKGVSMTAKNDAARTAFTPGSASAAEVSMLTIFA